ncbi:MAG: D-alanine--D-alanine ligase [Clostridia bacterium]|nr:D-alanine--D-alanine ligase [Clostridia bacterium]
MKKTVAIIFGGQSSEYEISCISAANVAENIDTSLFDLVKIGITKDGKWWLYEGDTDSMRHNVWYELTEKLRPAVLSPCSAHHGILALNGVTGSFEVLNIDVAFPVMHGRNGEDGTMQGLLTLSGIPFVGCGTAASAAAMDKEFTKIIASHAGVPVVPFVSAVNTESEAEIIARAEKEFSYPMFVKPANAGSSVGITKCGDAKSLEAGIKLAFENDGKLLIEPSVAGREIEVAVCGNESPIASVCGEIIPHSEFYDYETKYLDDCAECIAPANVRPAESDAIRASAIATFRALGCAGFARVDFFLLPDGRHMLNEINTIPGFTPISMYPKLMACVGVGYSELITRLITLATENRK